MKPQKAGIEAPEAVKRAVRISRYGRYWAVHDQDGTLVCVAVYKKGAEEITRRLVSGSGSPGPDDSHTSRAGD